jgi:hypothetical protein
VLAQLAGHFACLCRFEPVPRLPRNQRQPFRREPEVDLQQLVERAQEQGGDEQDHEAERDLRRDQRMCHAGMGSETPVAEGGGTGRRGRRRAHRRRQPEQHGGEAADCGHELRSPPIQPRVEVDRVLVGRQLLGARLDMKPLLVVQILIQSIEPEYVRNA